MGTQVERVRGGGGCHVTRDKEEPLARALRQNSAAGPGKWKDEVAQLPLASKLLVA